MPTIERTETENGPTIDGGQALAGFVVLYDYIGAIRGQLTALIAAERERQKTGAD